MINNLFDLGIVKRVILRRTDARCFHIGKKKSVELRSVLNVEVLVYLDSKTATKPTPYRGH